MQRAAMEPKMPPNSTITQPDAPSTVRWWARALAWIIVICALLAYGTSIYRFFQRPTWPDALQALQIFISLWLLPLFAYAAFKGKAPRSWPGIGSALNRDGSSSRWAALAKHIVTRAAPSVVLPDQTSLLNLPELVPPGFRYGIEIFNDNATPMEFVVSALSAHLGLSHGDSVQAMLSIHKQGGALLPTASLADAKRAAEAITAAATEQRHPLICRAVSVKE
jgi:ATP-dependent Clp protease adaptor protein ClpS